jgi:pyruvate/2-oxoglutarate dehydrogenase complex dihydrolipoamide dehydrogenase (E3) component
VIIGGGFIAIEMALAFARRDVIVTMLIRSDRLGSGVGDDFTIAMRSTLEDAGVKIFFNTTIGSSDTTTLTLKNTEK